MIFTSHKNGIVGMVMALPHKNSLIWSQKTQKKKEK
jgi:hypothetical protein